MVDNLWSKVKSNYNIVRELTSSEYNLQTPILQRGELQTNRESVPSLNVYYTVTPNSFLPLNLTKMAFYFCSHII